MARTRKAKAPRTKVKARAKGPLKSTGKPKVKAPAKAPAKATARPKSSAKSAAAAHLIANPRSKMSKAAVSEGAEFQPNFKPTLVEATAVSKPAHLQTRNDRYEIGRALRVQCAREAQAEFVINRKGRHDPIELLSKNSEGRVARLMPIRYGRMAESPFAFYRGAAAIMAHDLASTTSTQYAVQSCGDCHLLNFGAFGTPERNVLFDINDFDETYPATWEWDLKRLATSFILACVHNGHSRADGIACVERLVQAYADRLRELTEMPTLEAWYSHLKYEDVIALTADKQLKKLRKQVLSKALNRDSAAEFIKLAQVEGGTPRIKDQPPLIYHAEDHESEDFQHRLKVAIEGYRASLPPDRQVLLDKFELVDIAMKVVGVGSVGTICAIGLFFAAENDPLFLQFKEARPSVLEAYSPFKSTMTHSERVVTGQRIMQASSDLFLGHFVGERGVHFYVRQLRDVKITPMIHVYTAENMLGYARNCGWVLARAHARSGDPAIIAGYIGKSKVFANAIAHFADAYAHQNDADHKQLLEAIREGKIEAVVE